MTDSQNSSGNSNSNSNNSGSIRPEKTPLLIGQGITIRGEIVDETQDPESRMMILGVVEGNITTKGIIQISKGAIVKAGSIIEAGEIVVSGRLVGETVTVRTNVLVLQSSGHVEVDCVQMPPGGLELSRGGVLIARLDMSEHSANLEKASSPAKLSVLQSSPANTARSSGFESQFASTNDGSSGSDDKLSMKKADASKIG